MKRHLLLLAAIAVGVYVSGSSVSAQTGTNLPLAPGPVTDCPPWHHDPDRNGICDPLPFNLSTDYRIIPVTGVDGGWSAARALNNNNVVVGWVMVNGAMRAARWQITGAVAGPPLQLSGFESEATGVNDRGQVVGWIRQEETRRAVLWDFAASGGHVPEPQSLGVLPDHKYSAALAINQEGVVVGWSAPESEFRDGLLPHTGSASGRRAFRWTPET